MNAWGEANLSTTPLIAGYLPRPRLDRILDQATGGTLLYVIAGTGYGKTQAVHRYVERRTDAAIRWIQLTEEDNVGSRYWESLTHSIASDDPDLAARLREFGFPDTPTRFKQFAEIIKDMAHRPYKTLLIFDDFHLIHSPAALTFAEQCVHLQIPQVCIIIISRTEPKINAVSLFASGEASRITENELRFTEDEIGEFLEQNDILFSTKDLPRFAKATQGWALAVRLLSFVLKRNPDHLDQALVTLRQNIFQLFEAEAWETLQVPVQKILARLPLVTGLPFVSLREVVNGSSLLQGTPELASFVWFDSFTGDYQVHPLYKDFVKSKEVVLSDEEKQDVYRRAAQWCSENGFYMDAVQYYAKLGQYDCVVEALFSYPFKLPVDACVYFLDILEKLDPDHKEQSDLNVLFLKNFFVPLLLLGANRHEEARQRSLDAIQEWEHDSSPFAPAFLGIAYSNLAYIDMYTCTITHHYDAPKYLKKSIEYFKKSPLPPAPRGGAFAVPDIRSYACVVGEGATLVELGRFLEALGETASLIEEAFHDMYYGYDDLVACEVAYFKNQIGIARTAAHRAALKAREKNQYSIEAMAKHYLLLIALQEGDYQLVKEMFKQMRDQLNNPDFWSRQTYYDLDTGLFYAQIGLPEMVPTWFIMDEREQALKVRVPARELVVSAKYYIASKEYEQALTMLCAMTPREPQERFLFGELILSLLMAVAKIKNGDVAGALVDFEKAWQLSFEGVFEMPFIELGKDLHPLVVAALKQPDGAIPDEWLTMIDRKASAYAKKATVIRNAIKRTEGIKEPIKLSDRELNVLKDLYQGLSREEIAAHQHLSINTVKKAMQSLYIKLGASNVADAIRIAIKDKLIE